MSSDSLREKIRLAEFRRDNCRRKALACESYDPQRAAMFDEFADAAEREADELRGELIDEEDEEGYRALREHLADIGWARQG